MGFGLQITSRRPFPPQNPEFGFCSISIMVRPSASAGVGSHPFVVFCSPRTTPSEIIQEKSTSWILAVRVEVAPYWMIWLGNFTPVLQGSFADPKGGWWLGGIEWGY